MAGRQEGQLNLPFFQLSLKYLFWGPTKTEVILVKSQLNKNKPETP